MNRLRALLADQRGFTLVEMMVATAIMGFVLSAALLSLQAGTQASDVTTGRAEAQSSIRFALDRMIADMRAAGYDPTIANFDPIDSASMGASTVMLNTDLNANGTLDTSFGTAGKVVTAVGTRDSASGLAIQSDGKIVLGGSVILPNGNISFALVRYNSNGSPDNKGPLDAAGSHEV
jgi:uncharacterized delta-60 repeat protein/prepilin-type N-terminal cleavage/methylation domain-containing protein